MNDYARLLKQQRERADTSEAVFAILFAIGLMFYAPVVARDGWAWFMHPLGLPLLNYWEAWGTFIFARFMVGSRVSTSGDNDSSAMGTVVAAGIALVVTHALLWWMSH